MKNSLITGFAFLLFHSIAIAGVPEEGKTIFMSRCASCHNVNKVSVGPALAGVDQRRSIEWITKFVTSSQTLIKSGDTAALAIFEKFNRVPMPDHPDLGPENIANIVEYIKSQSTVTETTAPFARPRKLQTAYKPLSLAKDWPAFAAFVGIVALLILTMLFAINVKERKVGS